VGRGVRRDLEQAVLRAANLGDDDADTTAAIAGQLAGAKWGASEYPDAMAAAGRRPGTNRVAGERTRCGRRRAARSPAVAP
jgi:hypothetical protein